MVAINVISMMGLGSFILWVWDLLTVIGSCYDLGGEGGCAIP